MRTLAPTPLLVRLLGFTPLAFQEVGGWSPQPEVQPPAELENALDFIQDHLARVSPFAPPRQCPLCGHALAGSGYHHRYTYQGWTWTDLDRHHGLFAHVPGDGRSGYYLPPPGFVAMVLNAYAPYARRIHRQAAA